MVSATWEIASGLSVRATRTQQRNVHFLNFYDNFFSFPLGRILKAIDNFLRLPSPSVGAGQAARETQTQ